MVPVGELHSLAEQSAAVMVDFSVTVTVEVVSMGRVEEVVCVGWGGLCEKVSDEVLMCVVIAT